jgi:hypothetical protein
MSIFRYGKENNKYEKMMTTSNGTQKIKQGENRVIIIMSSDEMKLVSFIHFLVLMATHCEWSV